MTSPFDPNYKPILTPEPAHERDRSKRITEARERNGGTGFDRVTIGLGVAHADVSKRLTPRRKKGAR